MRKADATYIPSLSIYLSIPLSLSLSLSLCRSLSLSPSPSLSLSLCLFLHIYIYIHINIYFLYNCMHTHIYMCRLLPKKSPAPVGTLGRLAEWGAEELVGLPSEFRV